jgi:hypothetical protein
MVVNSAEQEIQIDDSKRACTTQYLAKGDAEQAFDLFVATYDAKYPKATSYLQKTRVGWRFTASQRGSGRASGRACDPPQEQAIKKLLVA